MTAPVVGVRQAVEQLDQVLDEHGHLIGSLAAWPGGRWRRLEGTDLEGLRAPTALGDAELNALSRPQNRARAGQGGRVHKHFSAVITGEEAEPFVGVIPLDLASRHENNPYAR